jgi:hypothetical protein
MTTINAVNTTLAGQIGTGAFAGTTSPAFTTPDLGVADAASIDFGQTPLDYYDEDDWTPIDTSGASLVFSTAIGKWTRFGRMVIANCQVVYPVTVNGSAAQIGGLPFTVANNNSSLGGLVTFTTISTLAHILSVPNSTVFNLFTANGTQVINSALSTSTNYFQIIYFV